MADSDIAIVGLVVTGGVNQNVLQWAVDDPNISGLPYLRFSVAEVWMSLSPTMAGAVKLDDAYSIYVDQGVPLGQQRYYQVRAKNRSDQFGEFTSVQSATELSGDFILSAPAGYWKHPSGLIMEWGQATTDANGTALATFFNNQSNVTLMHISAQVQHDDTANGRTEVWGVSLANVTITGSSFVATLQVRRVGHAGALSASNACPPAADANLLEPAPAGIPVLFFSIGAQS